MAVTAANVHDSVLFEALLDDLPAVVTPSGQRQSRPGKVHADKGYDHRRCRRYLAGRRITSRIARRGVESSTRLGRHRWKVERSLAWLGCYRRIQVRWERYSGRFFGFVVLACALLCFRTLQQPRF
jgi:transposase